MNLPGAYDHLPKGLQPHGLGQGIGDSFSETADDRFHFRQFLNILRRRMRLFAAIVCAVLVLGVIITALQPRIYEANAIVMLRNPDQKLQERVTNSTDEQIMQGDADVSTEIQVIGSRELADRVAKSLRLIENPQFNPYLAPKASLLERLFGREEKPVDLKTLTPEEREKMEVSIAQRVRSGLGAMRIGTAYSVAISYRHADPELAAQIANAYAHEYANSQVNSKKESTKEATAFLADKVEELRRQATADFAAVQAYRVKNGLLSNSATTLAEQDISVYNQQTASARAEAAADVARLNTALSQLRGGSLGDDVGEALDSPVVSSLRTQRAQIGARVADLSARYGGRHPELLRAKEELSSVDRQIQEEIDRVISNLEAKAAVSQQRLASLNASLGSAESDLARNNSALVALDDLQRRSQASQGLYESYLARYRELVAGSGTEQPEARVLTEATTPSFPASPRIFLNMVLAGMIGLVMGVVAAIAAEMQYKGLTTASDVEKRVGLPYLGLTPEHTSLDEFAESPLATLSEFPNSILAESVRGIYSAAHIPVNGRAKVLAISSALQGEGKTMLSAMLGETAASTGARTVIVDCDIVLRGLSHLTGFEEGPGLRELMAGQCTLDEALRQTGTHGLTVLPITSRAEAGERLTGNGAIHAIVAQLKERFDVVLLDCAPLLAIAEAREIAGLADGVILAVHWRKTSGDAVRAAAKLLPARLAAYTGVVLSQVNLHKQSRFANDDSSAYAASYQHYVAAA
jgi:polysaccharide biosynthesis transport protein